MDTYAGFEQIGLFHEVGVHYPPPPPENPKQCGIDGSWIPQRLYYGTADWLMILIFHWRDNMVQWVLWSQLNWFCVSLAFFWPFSKIIRIQLSKSLDCLPYHHHQQQHRHYHVSQHHQKHFHHHSCLLLIICEHVFSLFVWFLYKISLQLFMFHCDEHSRLLSRLYLGPVCT